ncbi:MAG: hypothetical protein FGM57_01295 [Candidatus Taylorbacteria bacterium]|nr:hypothetical protein [Candidatus Taylorbacteria bacterium]
MKRILIVFTLTLGLASFFYWQAPSKQDGKKSRTYEVTRVTSDSSEPNLVIGNVTVTIDPSNEPASPPESDPLWQQARADALKQQQQNKKAE